MKRGPECSEGTSSNYQFWGGELLIFQWMKLFDEKKLRRPWKMWKSSLVKHWFLESTGRKGEPKNLLQKTFVFLDRRLPWKNDSTTSGLGEFAYSELFTWVHLRLNQIRVIQAVTCFIPYLEVTLTISKGSLWITRIRIMYFCYGVVVKFMSIHISFGFPQSRVGMTSELTGPFTLMLATTKGMEI